jgi:hypothetical protein
MFGFVALRASRASLSNSSNVLMMIVEDFKQFRASEPKKSYMISFRSVTLMKLGMSLSRIFFKPEIQSKVVSKVPSVMKFSSEI